MLKHRLPYFNSIKVQLKQVANGRQRVCSRKFQFHKGTIKTVVPL